jgi:hypothetical protein
MTYPISVTVSFDLTSGPNFDPPFLIGISQLGIGVLGAGGTADEVVDLTDETISIQIRRGRDLNQDRFNPGTCTVRIIDEDASFNPQNVSSPYFGLLQPLRKMVIVANYEGTTYPLFAGYTTAYNYQYPKSEEIGYVDIQCTDAFNLFNKSAITTLSGAADGDTTGDRINQILDEVGFPTSQRNIDIGDITVQDDPGTLRSVLQALEDVEFTELGAIYIDPRGDVIFRERTDAVETIAATPTVFNQSTGINYSQLKLTFNDQLIFNVANFKRVGGTMQTFFDQSSIDDYFPHAISRENLLHQSDADTLDLAKAYIANRATTDIRIDAITLDLTSPNYGPGIEAALGLDFFDPVEISNDQPGGSTITKTLQIFGVQHNITPNSWFTTLTTGEPIITGFIIGNATFGLLGVSRL